MKLILIHGRAQENFEETVLKQEWINALNKGLKKSNLSLPIEVEIEFPYYGKLLEKLIKDTSTLSISDNITRSGSKPTVSESKEFDFYKDFLGEIIQNSEITADERHTLELNLNRERGILNWESIQELLAFLDKKQIFGDIIIKNFTRDVFMYLTINKIKEKINEHIKNSFSTEECVVVGHSLGSIVSYLVLKNNPQFHVKKFITIGSPLGLTSVRKYLEGALRMPECIKNGWFNAYDERDVVALNPLDKKHFNILPPIENKNDVNNYTDNRHGIVGYLEDAIIAKTIYQALVS